MKRLRMATKLGLAIIPIGLVALAAGALVARNALDRADSEERASLAAAVAADAMDSLVTFSAEHALALDIAVGGAEGGLESRQTATDAALTRLSESVGELTPRASGSASGIVAGIAGDSSRVRSLVERLRQDDPATPESAETVTDIGQRLISVVTQSTFYLGDEARAREGEGAVALARASFASLQEELLIVQNEFGQSIDEETFAQQMLVLESTVEDWINTATASSPTVEALGFARTQRLTQDQGFTSETFPADRNAVLADAASEILVRVSDSAEAAASDARTQAGTVGVIVVGALVLAAITALIVGRSTTRRVRSITAAAHHVAEVDLPKMVDSLSNPSGVLEVSEPVDVDKTGKDEVGDLARSFSVLHTTLVDVANQQMETLRRGVSDIFVTLARRNRSLVDRQLALVDELEAREEDPEVLEGYYKLDHLATRMRRNAESLLVLAGAESPRMWSEPVEMGEVVRAALGEVDEYQRIEVLAMEPSMLTGRAVSDLSHLISELLDNATQFSSPTERVRVTGLFDDEGYVITIADSGVGMSTERMSGLNHLMENPPVLGLALEPTLGTYVVARLAMRHGIKVKLVPGVPGTTVRVTIPRSLLETGKVDVPVEPDDAVVEEVTDPVVGTVEALPVPTAPSSNGRSPAPVGDLEVPGEIAAADDDTDSGDEPFEAPRAGDPVNDSATEAGTLRRRPTPTFSPRIDEVMKTPEPTEPAETASAGIPRHAASAAPDHVGREPEAPSDQQPQPESDRALPTRRPGTSFHETNELAASSATSQSTPTGIRNALDGFSQGRDIATQRSREPEVDDPGSEDEDVT
jgi:signal transduction histidine kinase